MVVALTLGAGGETARLEAFVSAVETASGDSRRLDSPLRIVAQRSIVGAIYPLELRQNVFSNVREVINGHSATQWCNSESCPIKYTTGDGAKVPFSEGFCCVASLFSGAPMRNGIPGNVFGQYFTSSCLSFEGARPYQVLSIGEPETIYGVTVQISYLDAETNEFIDEELFISARAPVSVSAKNLVKAQLVGDFANLRSTPVLSNHYFFKGSDSAKDLLLPFNLVDLSGRTPDKVGVSFEGFNKQANPCSQPYGSGLDGQIDGYIKSDLERTSRGLRPEYLISRYDGRFKSTTSVGFAGGNLNGTFIFLENESPASSLVTLTINADRLRFIENFSPGRIESAFVEPFEALAVSGAMRVLIANTGRISAGYFVSILNCSNFILPIEAQPITLQVLGKVWLTFDIRSTTALGMNDNQCTVRLQDSQFATQDTVVVLFNTTDANVTFGAQDGNSSGDGSSSDIGDFEDQECATCSYFDISCQLGNGCVADLLKAAGSILLPAAGILIALKVLSSPTVRAMLGRCLCPRRRRVIYEPEPEPRYVAKPRPAASGKKSNGLLSLVE